MDNEQIVKLNNNLLTVEQGKELAGKLLYLISDNKEVVLDFKEVKLISAVFLNAIFNDLLTEFSIEFINQYIKYINVNDKFLLLLKLVINNKQIYYDSNVLAKVISNIEV